MTDPALALLAAFSLGFLSSAHCVGMCGGIMGALTMAVPPEAKARRLRLVLCYNLGRIGSYTLMGAGLGALAGALHLAGLGFILRLLAALLLIAMGLYLADWWRGLTWLERGGRHLWAYLQPLGKALMPVTSAPKALALGGLWGWLPCGLVYTALAYSATQANPLLSGAVMLAFGLGTLPAVMATGLAARQVAALLQRRGVRRGFALLIIAFGLWTLLGGSHMLGHGPDHDHAPTPEAHPAEHRHAH